MRTKHVAFMIFICAQNAVFVACKASSSKMTDQRTNPNQTTDADGFSSVTGEDTVIDLADDFALPAGDDMSLAQGGWPANVVPMNMGTQYANNITTADIDEIATMGFKYIRIGAHVMLPGKVLDSEMAMAKYMWTKGITPFVILNSNPPPTDAASITKFAAAAKALAVSLKDGPAVFELWNEPNGPAFWPNPSPVAYANFATEVAAAMKSAGTGHQIVAGDINNLDQDGLTWLEKVMQTHPDLLTHLDAISLHGYQVEGSANIGKLNPEGRLAAYNKVRAMTTKYGHTLPVVLSEWGWSEGAQINVGSTNHAAFSVRMLLGNMYAGLPVSILYQWRDGSFGPIDKYGLKTCGGMDTAGHCVPGSNRPAYAKVAEMMSRLRGYAFLTRLGAGSSDYILVFKNPTNGALKAAVWTTGATHNVTVNKKGKPTLKFAGVSGMPKYIDIAPNAI